jgi:hypothetical protein
MFIINMAVYVVEWVLLIWILNVVMSAVEVAMSFRRPQSTGRVLFLFCRVCNRRLFCLKLYVCLSGCL